MVAAIVGWLLNWLHVISAIGWLGAAMLFGMLIGPTLPSFSPGGRGEFIVKVFPKFARYVTLLALSTVVFGASLAIAMSGGDFSVFQGSMQWGLFIDIGALLALTTISLALGIVVPTMRKMVKLVTAMQANPTAGPSPELPALQKKLRMYSTLGLALLILVVVCMVGAAWSPGF